MQRKVCCKFTNGGVEGKEKEKELERERERVYKHKALLTSFFFSTKLSHF